MRRSVSASGGLTGGALHAGGRSFCRLRMRRATPKASVRRAESCRELQTAITARGIECKTTVGTAHASSGGVPRFDVRLAVAAVLVGGTVGRWGAI